MSSPIRSKSAARGTRARLSIGTRRWLPHGLWDQGLGLAEAMDTAQRGMGVDWLTAKELIERTMAAAKAHPMKPRVACGAGTDHMALADLRDADAIIAAYETQMAAIEAAGGQLILMASRAFTAMEADEDIYRKVYRRLIDQAKEPVILHWLGDMFDPALKGYWGSAGCGRGHGFRAQPHWRKPRESGRYQNFAARRSA